MKKIILGIFVFVSFLSNAQETEFTFTSDKGMTDFIVTSIEGKTATDIYKKVIEWIKVTYKNPSEVMLSTIENEYVRFEGISDISTFKCKYQIEISIKEGKYKFVDNNVYSFINIITNEEFKGIRYDFQKKYGLKYKGIYNLITNKAKTYKGWKIQLN
jgi:hypothetical protein